MTRLTRIKIPLLLVFGLAAAAAAILIGTSRVDAADLYPSLTPLSWPGLPLAGALGVLLAVLPAWLSPPPPAAVAATAAPDRVAVGAAR